MGKTILITGATGNIGSYVIPQLLEGGATVRALVRDVSKASGLTEAGVKIFEGDFSDQEKVNHAASGADAILAITPAGPEAVVQGNVLLNAALASGSPYYVRLSAIGAAKDAPTDNGCLHFQSDDALIKSGLPYTILRPHYFMQNIFASLETINTDGNMYWGMEDGKLGMIDVRDIADCCASLLLGKGHEGKIYTPTGPDTISFQDIADIISRGLHKAVTYVPISIEAVGEAIRNAGWGEWGARVMMDYSRAYAQGWGDFTNDDVEIITGNKSRSFQQFYDEVFAYALKS
ncbi:MAG: NmrA family NAD(P)-binding protein [Bacteroidales bacterium]